MNHSSYKGVASPICHFHRTWTKTTLACPSSIITILKKQHKRDFKMLKMLINYTDFDQPWSRCRSRCRCRHTPVICISRCRSFRNRLYIPRIGWRGRRGSRSTWSRSVTATFPSSRSPKVSSSSLNVIIWFAGTRRSSAASSRSCISTCSPWRTRRGRWSSPIIRSWCCIGPGNWLVLETALAPVAHGELDKVDDMPQSSEAGAVLVLALGVDRPLPDPGLGQSRAMCRSWLDCKHKKWLKIVKLDRITIVYNFTLKQARPPPAGGFGQWCALLVYTGRERWSSWVLILIMVKSPKPELTLWQAQFHLRQQEHWDNL